MQTYTIVGKDSGHLDAIFKDNGYTRDDTNPEVVISFGGDGTLLLSEHMYPSIPKLFLRNSLLGNLGFKESNDVVLDNFFAGKLTIKEYFKIEAEVKNKKVFAVNEFSLKNKNPRHSIRFDVYINEKKVLNHIIGDGLMVSTPIGSTGYYKSITRSTFELGLGLAFNNTTEQYNHMVLKEDSVIKIVMLRGPGFCYVDNHEEEIGVGEGDEILIKKSSRSLRLFSKE
jgi:NAD kinase